MIIARAMALSLLLLGCSEPDDADRRGRDAAVTYVGSRPLPAGEAGDPCDKVQTRRVTGSVIRAGRTYETFALPAYVPAGRVVAMGVLETATGEKLPAVWQWDYSNGPPTPDVLNANRQTFDLIRRPDDLKWQIARADGQPHGLPEFARIGELFKLDELARFCAQKKRSRQG